ncbi:collagen-binding domain-containing protein [Halomarina salina]|uniref:Collagen-binding domain-containing protein n=1 Tax=Halomarina salina TaxID=1872699 RepID=A0ABD5RNG1_9EURY|nr:collagen-binding domain-containing protein [Halomarina salina]
MDHSPQRTRAQSEVLGFVLLVGMVAVAVTTIVVIGGGAMDDLTEASNAENAEIMMSQFDSQVSAVSLGDSDRQSFTFSGDGSASVDEGAGTITVTQIGCGSCSQEILHTHLGAVKYMTGSTTVAYQGGGVWRTDGQHTRMVSPPEFHYTWRNDPSSNPTLTFPVVSITGSEPLSGPATISKTNSKSLFPGDDAAQTNPLSSGSIEVVIQSEYYEGWATYFEERTSAESVDVDDEKQLVTVILSVPNKSREVADGIATADPTLKIQGSGGVDSYDSSVGSYAATKGEEGSVFVGNGLKYSGGSTIKGDMRINGDFDAGGGIDVTGRLIVNGDVTFGGGSKIDNEVIADGDLTFYGNSINAPVTIAGDIYTKGGSNVNGEITAGGDFDWDGNSINDNVYLGGAFNPKSWNEPPAGTVHEHYAALDLSAVDEAADLTPPEMTAIDPTIEARVDAYRATNDNTGSDASRIEAGHCADGYSSCTLTAGTYYFDDFELQNDDITFDTSDGPIYIAVDGEVSSTGSASVQITGSDRVHLYTTGDTKVTSGTTWKSDDSRGDHLWLYGSSSSTVKISGGATFYGVVYAPSNEDITVTGGSDVYGALVGSASKVTGDSAVHYDIVLKDQKPDLVGGGGVPLTYLHISHNEVVVKNAN